MREIKYRAKCFGGTYWRYGWPVQNATGQTFIQWIGKDEFGMPSMDSERVQPETLSQYTGLRDGFDREIYEGDIMQFGASDSLDFGDVYYSNGTYIVRGKEVSVDLGVMLNDPARYNARVVSNVFDNPKLLGNSWRPL